LELQNIKEAESIIEANTLSPVESVQISDDNNEIVTSFSTTQDSVSISLESIQSIPQVQPNIELVPEPIDIEGNLFHIRNRNSLLAQLNSESSRKSSKRIKKQQDRNLKISKYSRPPKPQHLQKIQPLTFARQSKSFSRKNQVSKVF